MASRTRRIVWRLVRKSRASAETPAPSCNRRPTSRRCSAVRLEGRPSALPAALARSRPAWVRSTKRSRSNSATALMTLVVSLPVEQTGEPGTPGGRDAAKLHNAVAVAGTGREGEVRFFDEVDASPEGTDPACSPGFGGVPPSRIRRRALISIDRRSAEEQGCGCRASPAGKYRTTALLSSLVTASRRRVSFGAAGRREHE
jgi:hypothetical protein